MLIKDNEARLKSAQLLWNKEKQGGGKILENITLIRPHIKLGKAKYWLLFPQNFISPCYLSGPFERGVGYQVLVSFCRKHYLAILPKPLWLARFKALRDGYYPMALLLDIT